MNVGDLKAALDDYGDHVEVILAADDLGSNDDEPVIAVESSNRPDGPVVILGFGDGHR